MQKYLIKDFSDCRFPIRKWLSLGLLAALGHSAQAASITWLDGGTANLNTGSNWVGGTVPVASDSLTFGATSGVTTLNNDLTINTTGSALGTVTFAATAPAYTIGGNAVTGGLGGFVVNSAPGGTQMINLDFTVHANAVPVTGAGDLALNGAFNKGGTWNPVIAMNGTGVLTIGGSTKINSAGGTGAWQVNSGTMVLAKTVAGNFNVSLTTTGGTVKLGAVDQLKAVPSFTMSGGTLDLNGFDSQALVLTTSTPGPTLNGTGGLITNNAAGSGTNVLYIGAASTNSVFGGTISDGATAKVGVTVYDPGAGSNFAVLSGKNNYSGGTIIRSITTADRAATLSIANVASIGSVGNRNLTFFGNSASAETVLQLTGTAVTNSNQFDSLTFTSGKGVGFDVADSANTFTLGKNAGGTDIAMSGAGNLQKRGAGTLEIASNLTYTGATHILGGTLKINAAAGGALASSSPLGLGGGEFHLLGKTSGTTTQTLGNVSLDLHNFNYQGNGASKITVDANGGSGTTLTLGTMANTTWYGNTLNVKVTANATVTTTSGGTLGLIGNGRVVFTDASNFVDFAGKSGSNIAAATYTAELPASASTSTVNYSHTDNAAVNTSESVNALKLTTSTTGQALTIDPGQTLTLISGGLLFTGANDYSITGGTLKSNSATNSDLIIHQYGAGKLTIDSIIANGIGNSALTKAGTGTLTLTGANTHTGLNLVTGGILSISADSNLGGTNGTFANLTSGTGSASVTYTGSLPTGFVVGSVMLGRTVNAINTGTSTITLSGNANTALTGGTASWAFTGVTDFNYDSANLYLNSGGVLQATSTFSLQEINTGGTAGTTTANRRVTIGTGGGSFDVTGANVLTVPGNINGTGTLTKDGTGTLALNGANTLTGGVLINDGTLRVGKSDAMNANGSAGALKFGAGTTAKLQLNGNSATVTSLVSANTAANVENGVSGTQTLTVSNGADNTYAGKLQNGTFGVLSLTKSGGGTLTLSGANTYSGLTTVANGTLTISGVGSFGATTGALTVSGGTLDLAGTTQTKNGVVTISGGTISNGILSSTTAYAGQSGTVSAALAGSSTALNKTTTGTLTLSGANTYGGLTTVSAGLLAVNGTAIPDANSLVINGTGKVSVTGTEVVASLTLGDTTYTTGSFNATTSPAYIAAGTIQVGAATGFTGWINTDANFANPALLAGKHGANDDADNDGISNLMEYAIAGQDPTVGNATVGTVVGNTLSYPKREGTSGLTYAIEESTDLGITDAWAEVPAGASYVNDTNTISYTLPGGPVRDFARLKVTQAP